MIYSFHWMMDCKQLLKMYELGETEIPALKCKTLKHRFSLLPMDLRLQKLRSPTAWLGWAIKGPGQVSVLQSLRAHLSLSWYCTHVGDRVAVGLRGWVYFFHPIKKLTFRKSNTTWEQHSVVLGGTDSFHKRNILSTGITAIIPYLRGRH